MLRATLLPLLGLLVALPGCQFASLRRDLEDKQRIASVSGSVVEETPSDSPVVVALFADEKIRENMVNARLSQSRKFSLDVLPGTYIAFAYADENRDFDYQVGEPAGYHGDPTPIVVGAGDERIGIEITLRRDLVLPKIAGDGSAPRDGDDSEFERLWAGRRNVGRVAALEDERFDARHARTGMWQPVRYSLELGPGLFFLEPYDPDKTPVLFIHGMAGSPRDWRSIIDQLDRSRFQPWVLAYASGLPIDMNASYLYDAVNQMQAQHGFERLLLVAHSMGGLVAKAFIDRYPEDKAGALRLLVTLATPWGGHAAAQSGVDRAPAVVPSWRDMAPASDFLAAMSRSELPPDLPYYMMFGFRAGGFRNSVSNDGTVTVASQLEPAAQNRAQRIYGFDASHVGILSDERVVRLLDVLLDQADRGANEEAAMPRILLDQR